MSIRKGTILLTGGPQDISSKEDKANKVTSVSESSTDLEYPSAGALYRALLEKQNNLISGTNIKTINGESLLGSGNIEINGGGGSFDPYAYNIQTKQTLDLTNYSSDYFYPVTWDPTLAFVSLDIRSQQFGAANPYNQNRLSASISSMGYSDTPKTINVYESAQYDENEITIYGIYTGNTYGTNCVYLRGGIVYETNCNVTLTPHQSEYSYGSEDATEVFPIMSSSYTFDTTASNITKVWDAVGWKGYGHTSRGFQSDTAIVGRTLKINSDTDLTISGPSSGKVNFETIFGSGYVFDKPLRPKTLQNSWFCTGGGGGDTDHYVKLCNVKFDWHRQGEFVSIRIYIGEGNNGNAHQNAFIDLVMQVGWTGENGGRVGCKWELHPGGTTFSMDNCNIIVISNSNIDYDVYFYTNVNYCVPNYSVDCSDLVTVTHEGIVSLTAPTGTACNCSGSIVQASTVLYNNNSGTNANLTLTASAASHKSIEIFFRDNDNNYNSVKVFNPNGKNVALISQYNNGNNTAWFKIAKVTISGNSITFGNSEEVRLTHNAYPSISSSSNIYIIKVVGY